MHMLTDGGMISLALMLLAAHWVSDYPLQGDFLAAAKQKGPLRVYHLIAHTGGFRPAACCW